MASFSVVLVRTTAGARFFVFPVRFDTVSRKNVPGSGKWIPSGRAIWLQRRIGASMDINAPLSSAIEG